MWGDNNEPEPSFIYVTDSYKWDAWNDLRGTPKVVAKEKFLLYAEDVLTKRGLDLTDNSKPGKNYYDGCPGFVGETTLIKEEPWSSS